MKLISTAKNMTRELRFNCATLRVNYHESNLDCQGQVASSLPTSHSIEHVSKFVQSTTCNKHITTSHFFLKIHTKKTSHFPCDSALPPQKKRNQHPHFTSNTRYHQTNQPSPNLPSNHPTAPTAPAPHLTHHGSITTCLRG